MRGTERAEGPQFISQGDSIYPDRLIRRLGADAPKVISFVGSAVPLSTPMTAFLCSKETPGATILKAFDHAAAWRDSERCVISGFHSPLEQHCLDILLRGSQPVVMVLARGIGSVRLPAARRRALENGRLTIISQFPESEKRMSAELAYERNRFVAALADLVVFAYVSPGGQLARLAEEIITWHGTPQYLHV